MVEFLRSNRVNFDGTWAIIKGRIDDAPYVLRIRTDLGAIAGEQSLSLLFELRWIYLVCQDQLDDMPTPVQQDEMLVFENTIVDALKEERAALLVAVTTGQGSRSWFWYCSDRDRVERCVNVTLAGDPAFPIHMSITPDSDWSFYRDWLDIVESA